MIGVPPIWEPATSGIYQNPYLSEPAYSVWLSPKPYDSSPCPHDTFNIHFIIILVPRCVFVLYFLSAIGPVDESLLNTLDSFLVSWGGVRLSPLGT
jgi:hypothetical protein